MASYVVKPTLDEDFYVIWSTVVDDMTGAGTRAELLRRYGPIVVDGVEYERHDGITGARLDRADELGTSARWGCGSGPYLGWLHDGMVVQGRGMADPWRPCRLRPSAARRGGRRGRVDAHGVRAVMLRQMLATLGVLTVAAFISGAAHEAVGATSSTLSMLIGVTAGLVPAWVFRWLDRILPVGDVDGAEVDGEHRGGGWQLRDWTLVLPDLADLYSEQAA